MRIDYLKKRLIVDEPIELKAAVEEIAHLGLDGWVIVGVQKGNYLYGIAETDEWTVSVAS